LPLRRLDVLSPVDVPRALAHCAYLEHVVELHLRVGPTSSVMPEEFVVDLLRSTRLRRLRRLQLYFIPWTRGVADALRESPLLDQLEFLCLGHCTLRYSSGFTHPPYHKRDDRPLREALAELLKRNGHVFLIQPPGERDWHRCIAATKALPSAEGWPDRPAAKSPEE
jgi:hypothetical protein